IRASGSGRSAPGSAPAGPRAPVRARGRAARSGGAVRRSGPCSRDLPLRRGGVGGDRALGRALEERDPEPARDRPAVGARADAARELARPRADGVGGRAGGERMAPGGAVRVDLEEQAREAEPDRQRQGETQDREERHAQPRMDPEPAPARLAGVARLVHERGLHAVDAPAGRVAVQGPERGGVVRGGGAARGRAQPCERRQAGGRAPLRAVLRLRAPARLDRPRQRLEGRALPHPARRHGADGSRSPARVRLPIRARRRSPQGDARAGAGSAALSPLASGERIRLTSAAMSPLATRDPLADPAAWARELGISREAVELYLASDVLDLHVDSFIWTRIFGYDLRKRHGYGPTGGRFLSMVDLPRVREARLTGATWVITTNPLQRSERRPLVL